MPIHTFDERYSVSQNRAISIEVHSLGEPLVNLRDQESGLVTAKLAADGAIISLDPLAHPENPCENPSDPNFLITLHRQKKFWTIRRDELRRKVMDGRDRLERMPDEVGLAELRDLCREWKRAEDMLREAEERYDARRPGNTSTNGRDLTEEEQRDEDTVSLRRELLQQAINQLGIPRRRW